MLDTSQKTPYARAINQFAENKVRDAIALEGKAIPASVTAVAGSIVTVKFELNAAYPLPSVTIPMAGSEYIRIPVQVGDKGMVTPSDFYLGGVSGLGGGTAGVNLPANLSALVFIAISNKGWSTAEDPNKVILYGPNGAILRTVDKTAMVNVDPNGVTITVPAGKPFSISSLPVAPLGAGSLYNSGGFVKVA